MDCSSIRKLDLPSTIKTIEKYAFMNCNGFTSITLPSSLTRLEKCAFYACKKLNSVHIPSSVQQFAPDNDEPTTSKNEGIFYGCVSLTTIFLVPPQAQVTTTTTTTKLIDRNIPKDTFAGCFSLKSIKIQSPLSNMTACVVNLFKDLIKVLILQIDPMASCCTDESILPIHLLLMFGHIRYYKDGLENLIKRSQSTIDGSDPIYDMSLFQHALYTPLLPKDSTMNQHIGSLEHIETIYTLLRESPSAINDLAYKEPKKPINVVEKKTRLSFGEYIMENDPFYIIVFAVMCVLFCIMCIVAHDFAILD